MSVLRGPWPSAGVDPDLDLGELEALLRDFYRDERELEKDELLQEATRRVKEMLRFLVRGCSRSAR